MATVDMTVREALNMAIDEEMERDEAVYVMGEEVRSPVWLERFVGSLLKRFVFSLPCAFFSLIHSAALPGCSIPGRLQGDQGPLPEVRRQESE